MTGPARTVAIVVHALLLIIALGPAIAWGDIESDLDQLLAACAEKGLFSGSVLVAEQGRPVYLRSFGSAGIGSEEAIGPDHAFRLASVGKAFTAMSIMILAEEGCLTFEDEVKTHLPELPYDDITIRHLLNHTSGLPDYVVLLDEHWDREHAGSPDRKVATSGDALALFREHRPPAHFTPGERFEYSNTGYIMLGLIAERAAGRNFAKLLREKIFEPLEMHQTLLYSPIADPHIERRVYGHRISPDGGKAISTDFHYMNGMYGDGEIYSTPLDMLKWDQALYSNELVSGATLEAAFTPARLNDGSSSEYGFGWGISRDDEGRKVLSHGGGWVGFRTQIVREIEIGRLTVILSTGSRARFPQIQTAIGNILEGREHRVPDPPVAWSVGAAARGGGVAAAQDRFRELRAAADGDLDFYEFGLSALGEHYMREGNYDLAIGVLLLAAETFPDSVETHNALGRAYLLAGKADQAANCFDRSLALDPRDGNVANQLLKEIKP